MDAATNDILQKYEVSPTAWLGAGMEAEVYVYGARAVLKLYAGTTNLMHLTTLQHFYASVDRHHVPYALPRINAVVQEDACVVSIEQRLYGTPLSDVLASRSAQQLDQIMQHYLRAACALSAIQAPASLDRYKLFDPDHISQRTHGDWHQFLDRYLMLKLAQVTPYLSRDVSHLATKVQHLRAILAQPYRGDYCLIHGDFFPGNLLVNYEDQITALLDFGMLTMYGDYLFDIATSWVFFDMYDDLKVNARERYLSLILNTLGEDVRGILYQYVLMYSILSANTYSVTCTDGHYRWCIANLNNDEYWKAIA
ncbi:MAG: aminoglycoside phosphotransferase family protein [Chloroflexota bacterium]|nr:aminoglycoside phosphotransferase family protein [Chloroflexota bacterium]